MMMKVKSGETNLTWGNVNKENPLTSVCKSSTIISKRESPNASMSISFLILLGVPLPILTRFFNRVTCTDNEFMLI